MLFFRPRSGTGLVDSPAMRRTRVTLLAAMLFIGSCSSQAQDRQRANEIVNDFERAFVFAGASVDKSLSCAPREPELMVTKENGQQDEFDRVVAYTLSKGWVEGAVDEQSRRMFQVSDPSRMRRFESPKGEQPSAGLSVMLRDGGEFRVALGFGPYLCVKSD